MDTDIIYILQMRKLRLGEQLDGFKSGVSWDQTPLVQLKSWYS